MNTSCTKGIRDNPHHKRIHLTKALLKVMDSKETDLDTIEEEVDTVVAEEVLTILQEEVTTMALGSIITFNPSKSGANCTLAFTIIGRMSVLCWNSLCSNTSKAQTLLRTQFS